MSLSLPARRPRLTSGAVLIPGAVLAGGLLAVGITGLPPKLGLLLIGAAAVAGLALASRRPRSLLLAAAIVLLSIDVKSFPASLWLNPTHIGGAPGIVLTAQLVLLVPLAAIAIFERAGRRAPNSARLPAGTLLVPLIPILAVIPAVAVSRNQTLSIVELIRMVSLYLLYLYFAAEFRPSDTPLVAAALLVGVLLQVPFVAMEMVRPSFRFSFVAGTEVSNTLENIAGSGVKRVTGTLLHANVLGGYLGLILPIALAFALVPVRNRWLRPLAWVALLCGTLMLLLTFNRGSWIGFALAVPLVIVLAALQDHLSKAQTVGLLALVAVCAASFLVLPPVQERFAASDRANVDFRLDINRSAVAMWQAHPWIGAGLNTFAEAVGDFDFRNVSVYKWPVHNIYLLWLSETGIVGAAGMVIFLLWAAVRILRAGRAQPPAASLLAIGFAGGFMALFVGDLASFAIRFDSVSQAFFIVLGVCVALGRASPHYSPLGSTATPPAPSGVPALEHGV